MRLKDPVLSCNTDKTKDFGCPLKCHTRGIQICATNCGIIIGYREIFLAESKTQVAVMLLDIYDNYQSIYNLSNLLPKNFFILFNKKVKFQIILFMTMDVI